MARHRYTDYYHDESRKVVRSQPQGGVGKGALWVLDAVVMLLTVVSALALVGGLLSKVIDPRTTSLCVFMGLFYQVVYVVNIACALWWVVRWKRWFFISAAMLLMGANSIGLFYRSDAKVENGSEGVGRSDLVVATYNVRNFSDLETADDESNFHQVREWLNTQGVHIACLQEAHFSSTNTFREFRDGLKKMGYGFFANAKVDEEELDTGSGYAVLSTYPIVRHSVVERGETNIGGVWADIKVGRDTLRVFNLHLQSTGITSADQANTLSPQIMDDTMACANLSKIADKVVDNYRARASQAEVVARAIEESPHAVVVCGDFNDTPVSYTYHQILSEGLVDSFVEQGRGVEHTFRGLYDLFRIDYILSDRESFDVKKYNSFDLDYSDHKPVVVRLQIVENEI